MGNPNERQTISNDDPRVEYTGMWEQMLTMQNAQSVSLHSTAQNFSTASLTFYGSEIVVFGYIAEGGLDALTAVYTIDQGMPTDSSLMIVLPQNANSAPSSYGPQAFFHANSLNAQNHTLLINVTATGGDRNYTLDYFSVIAPAVAAASSESDSRKQLDEGALVGGVLGGVAFAMLLALMFVLWRRGRQSQTDQQTVRSVDIIGPVMRDSRGRLYTHAPRRWLSGKTTTTATETDVVHFPPLHTYPTYPDAFAHRFSLSDNLYAERAADTSFLNLPQSENGHETEVHS